MRKKHPFPLPKHQSFQHPEVPLFMDNLADTLSSSLECCPPSLGLSLFPNRDSQDCACLINGAVCSCKVVMRQCGEVLYWCCPGFSSYLACAFTNVNQNTLISLKCLRCLRQRKRRRKRPKRWHQLLRLESQKLLQLKVYSGVLKRACSSFHVSTLLSAVCPLCVLCGGVRVAFGCVRMCVCMPAGGSGVCQQELSHKSLIWLLAESGLSEGGTLV